MVVQDKVVNSDFNERWNLDVKNRCILSNWRSRDVK